MIKKSASPDYKRIIQSRQWLRLRSAYLSAHPLCEDCLLRERTEAATEVHHLRPIESAKGDPEAMKRLAYDPHNLRALCRPCHAQAHVQLQSHSKEVQRERHAQAVSAFVRHYFGQDAAPIAPESPLKGSEKNR